jgi:aminoglycoside phosphotransferase
VRTFPDDVGLVRVLRTFNVRPEALLGHGSEAWVYALDEERVIRVLHEGPTLDMVRASADLAASFARQNPPFALPQVLDFGQVDGRWYAIEQRLRGRSVVAELARLDRNGRRLLIEAYLQCSAQLGDLPLAAAEWWGDILRDPPVRAGRWREYLREKCERTLAAAGPDFTHIDADALVADLPDPEDRSFVHLDAFPGNILSDGTTITAVIDLGATTTAGDRRLDPLSSVVYLTSAITPTADDDDRAVARAWLRSAGLDQWLLPAERWLAAYWAFAVDDVHLHAWCRSVLLRA